MEMEMDRIALRFTLFELLKFLSVVGGRGVDLVE